MGRRRKEESDLPPRVYLRHGRYYHVHKGKWTALSKDKQLAIASAHALNRLDPGVVRPSILRELLEKSYRSRRSDAKKRGIPFDISLEDVLSMAERSRWRCQVTDIPFSADRNPRHRRMPFAPSIDRVIPGLGYISGNVRLVCLATNFAMNEWGEGVMRRLAEGWIRTEFRRLVLDAVQQDGQKPPQPVDL